MDKVHFEVYDVIIPCKGKLAVLDSYKTQEKKSPFILKIKKCTLMGGEGLFYYICNKTCFYNLNAFNMRDFILNGKLSIKL